ncbi:hypothetical protein B0E45_17320 [Sinorhizobium sp. A49]|nr:hypothetical protein B0E45_17320 [Sinorhizobium sp. A49]
MKAQRHDDISENEGCRRLLNWDGEAISGERSAADPDGAQRCAKARRDKPASVRLSENRYVQEARGNFLPRAHALKPSLA